MANMFGQMGEMRKLYSKYKKLQKELKKLIIRAKHGSFVDEQGLERDDALVVDITWEMKVADVVINDLALLDPSQKKTLEEGLLSAFNKAQTKAQEVAADKTKDILWFDPSDMAGMMWGGKLPGM